MFNFDSVRLSGLNPKTKKKIKKILPTLAAIVLLIATVVMTFYHATDGFTTVVDTEPAKIVFENDVMTFDAYILKNEKLLKSEEKGSYLYVGKNAQRVNPGDLLAKKYKNEVSESTLQLSNEIDRCIDILENSIGDGKFNLNDSKEVNRKISSMYSEIMRSVAKGNSSKISSVEDDFLVLLNRMKVYTGKTDELKMVLDEYKSKQKKIQKKYEGNPQDIRAEEGGYFFRDTDGYEDIYTSADIEKLTYDSFFEMTKKSPSDEKSFGKILLDYRWYLVIPTVKGISDTYSIGNEYEISFNDSNNRTMKMQLSNIIADESGAKTLMLFLCGTVDGSFDYFRCQKVSINHRNVRGFRITESALCELNGNTGVYILKDGVATFRKVIILYEGDGYYIVSAESSNSEDYRIYLELNDNIITDCRNMYEGKVIG